MQSHNKHELAANFFTGQEAKLEVPQPTQRPQFMPPNLLFPEERETPFNSDALALSEQITQRLPVVNKKQQRSLRVTILITFVLIGILFLIWHPSTSPTPAPAITQQSFSSTASTGNVGNADKNISSAAGGEIQVYIVGAVKNPGIYRMTTGARVYQLLQAAGGPLPDANLVTLNLAAKLSDGQEIYVARLGEAQPISTGEKTLPGSSGSTTGSAGTASSAGTQVNINTANVAELQKQLNIARTTAQNIVNYRLQHGAYTSIDQLLRVVRKTTYDKIKGMVTV